MSTPLTHFILKLFHVLLRCAMGLGVLLAIALCVLAIGFDGHLFQKHIDAVLSPEVGRLTVQHLAYRPGVGVIFKGVRLENAKGRCLVACERAAIDVRLISAAALQDRVKAIVLDDLFVAQIQHDPNKPPSRLDDIRDPFPDFNGMRLPQFNNVALTLRRPDVLEVRLQKITGHLDTRGGALFFHDLKGDIDSKTQSVEADIEVNLYEGYVDAHIRGNLYQTVVHGVYRALDFPIIETYSNNFKLDEPTWADCAFKVGFDKYRNIFNLIVKIHAKKGAYCGVAFDEAQGTIRCSGIWDAVTVIDPIIASRNGDVIATGKLRFDCPKDRFTFEANGIGITPEEALQLIDMPFTEAIPKMSAETPPKMYFRGSIPLLSEQSPGRVVLKGSMSSKTPFTFDRIQLKSVETLLSMQDGVFALDGLKGELPHSGTFSGRVDIHVPDTALYTDIMADMTLKQASLADLLMPFHMETLTNCVATGTATLSCRTDETFTSSVNATFDLTVDGGLIGRVPLFAGFTDIIADNIPGVSTITDTSTVHLKGTAENGIFKLPHFTLFGSLFMIEGPVTYDLPKDNLYAKIIAGVFKKDTFVGTLTRWATIPVTKMLWEVEVTGPIAKPTWKNKTIINKLWDYVPFTGDDNEQP
jgi:hypothetical protein